DVEDGRRREQSEWKHNQRWMDRMSERLRTACHFDSPSRRAVGKCRLDFCKRCSDIAYGHVETRHENIWVGLVWTRLLGENLIFERTIRAQLCYAKYLTERRALGIFPLT